MGIKALFFDLDDTLHDFKGASSKAMQIVYEIVTKKYGTISLSDLEIRYRELLATVEESAFFDGRTSNEYRTERFTALLSHFGINDDSLVETMVQTYGEQLRKNMALFPEVEKALRQLNDLDLYLVTDGPEDAQKKALEILGITEFFKDVFISGAVKKTKASGGLFEYALEKTGLNPDEVLVVGDSYKRDVKGALAAGIEAVLISKKHQPDETGIKPVATIGSINELKECLAKLMLKKK